MERESEYRECDECRIKSGAPTLCQDCLERRSEFHRTGSCRPPRVCSLEAQRKAKVHDLRIAAGLEHCFSNETESRIVQALSEADVGSLPEDQQFARMQTIMAELRTGSWLKTHDLVIRTVEGQRTAVIGWSRLLEFPSQTFSVRVSALTRQNWEILEVMAS
jgi:hypothetical protein